MLRELTIDAPGRGLHEITGEVQAVVDASGVGDGLATIFVRHTSASLLIQENADPSARRDLERWMDRHVPDLTPADGADFEHTAEGPDDMPSHIRAALTATSLGVPFAGGRLALGVWQGIFLWEHRRTPRARSVLVSLTT